MIYKWNILETNFVNNIFSLTNTNKVSMKTDILDHTCDNIKSGAYKK